MEFNNNGLQDIEDLTYKMSGGFGFYRQFRNLMGAKDQKAALEEIAKQIEPDIEAQTKKGIHVFRTNLPDSIDIPELKTTDNPRDVIRNYIGLAVMEAFYKYKAHLQLFVGVERGPRSDEGATESEDSFSYALNDPTRISKMHPFFKQYSKCTFEIVNAAQLSNLDIVQAAGIYPNVTPGGMWWFNFRRSVYNEVMQYRLEALPPTRCTLVATDARSIEWAYCKILTIKDILAKFLWKQIEEGYIDRETALVVAKEWLYGTASRLYV
jgi:hypothetical protein